LTQVVKKSAGGAILNTVTEAYDPLDRRIKEETTQWGFTSTTWFAYDGGHIALRFDGDGSLTGRYLHGEAVDQIFAEEVGGQTRWTLTDHLGSVRDVVSDTGMTLGRITYDSFGQVTNTTGIVDTLFRYTARPGMSSTGLYDYRARAYDPRIGQFLSEDPIGFAAGDPNLRRYVGNEPTHWVDPSGLQSQYPSIGAYPPYYPKWSPYQWYDDPRSWLAGTWLGKFLQDRENTAWDREKEERRQRWEAEEARKRRAEAAGRHPAWQFCLEEFPTLAWELLIGLGSARAGGGGGGVQARPGGGRSRPGGAAQSGPRMSSGSSGEGAKSAGGASGNAPRSAPTPGGIGRFPEWRVGGSITQAMPDGSYPSWLTIRSRYWQNRAAAAAPTEFGPQNLGAMRAGNPPSARVVVRNNATGQEQTIRVVKELHHARGGRGTPGFDTPVDLREVWPWEHAAIDPSRRLDYTFIRFATGN
jgi:RHS repeat-associated protein